MLAVLHDHAAIQAARKKLSELGADTSRGWRRRLHQLAYLVRFRQKAQDVAINKSWDTLTLLETIEKHVPNRSAAIFDMGSFNSEIPVSLWMRGYRNVLASDFNPLGRSIRWYGTGIRFRCEDFYEPSIPPGTLDVVTALSVIEHGYDQARLFRTLHRLLKPGGLALITTDYRADKREIPADYRLFNLTYRIFSRAEIESFLEDAKKAGFEPLGPLDWGNSQYPIRFLGHDMTFIFLGLRKVR